MAFFVKKFQVFLLPILLLTYSSQANDNLPQSRERDRKLLVGRGFFSAIRHGGAGVGDEFRATKGMHGYGGEFSGNMPEGVGHVSPENMGGHDPNRFKFPHYNEELPSSSWKIPEAEARKAGEAMAKKLFGANGKRGFRVGWRMGKWIYKVDKRCGKIEKFLNVSSCQPSLLPLMNCVIVVDGATGTAQSCTNNLISPEKTPCFFNGSVISKGNFVVLYATQYCSAT